MNLSASLKEGYSSRIVSMNVPVVSNPFLPIPMVDSRWARPFKFRDVSLYPLSEAQDVESDFHRYVELVNQSLITNKMDRYKDGLLKIVDEHINRCGRVLFCDLLMYVDCVAYLCYASDLLTESQIVANYASWAKFIVDKRKSHVFSSTKWGIKAFTGSNNEEDLNNSL